ncbi:RsmB/NOP family class I SAM-dependent RNA methyltransferase [Bartonella tamiae]|uniref:SAM-dependent MTase RsmB/NOP-type domain-containing protein n=1 Tax=Bartonella tamiae Th239 TaxID=1094558 RepID=J0QWQ9_9HYPH|nr:RsmB/NOP family class I SAM-dependent RNA methyltransferase [Bartonella tamiae]EJF90441.1 hypothetical protein ME5_00842 [Bartonella tamiae Th239]EJF93615.1 hypothetical protein MEG_01039 [Bartonella tamiae Th307]
MRLGGRLQAAIEVLQDIENRRRPVAEALKDWGLSHRFAGAGDRAAIGNIVYDALRRKLSLYWLMDSDDISALAYGALMSDGALSWQALEHALEGDKFRPKKLNADQRHSWENRNIHDAADYIQADVPYWCISHLQNMFGNNWCNEARSLSERPPLDLRVNTLKSSSDKMLRALESVHIKPIPWMKDALRIAPIEKLGRHPNVQAEPAFQKGFFEVQDLGSQIVAHLVGAKSGMQVLDYCAGAGGKSLALAAHMQNRGQIYAYDAEKARLAPIFERLRRADVRNVQPHAKKGDLAPLKQQMDIVLVDAPCTGTGTWRRRPDAKWRLSEAQVERRVKEQEEVLNAAMSYVKLGGHLVYITCSLFSSENDQQVSSFLKTHHDFHKLDMKTVWDNAFEGNTPTPLFSQYGLALSPLTTQTDGFFISILEKNIT